MDLEGRHTLSPSLLERDAYQAVLRKEKEKRGGLKFQILLGAMAANTAKECSIRIEMRGNKDQKPTEAKVEVPVAIHGMFQRWQAVEFRGAEYLALGELVAWRATLWRSGTLVSEQKSFLW